MTGFGRATAGGRGRRALCEIRTINHRHLDVSVSLPTGLQPLEPEIRRRIAAALARGRVEASVTLAGAAGAASRPVVDLALARRYGRVLSALARELKLAPPDAAALAALPGVVVRPDPAPAGREAAELVGRAVGLALLRVVAMRRREGAALARDLLGRIESVARSAERAEARWPHVQRAQQERSDEKLRQALDRLGEAQRSGALRELLATLERGDATEEFVRLRSHLAQVREALAAGSPAGRKLDFLVQELHREANTIGSKAGDAEISRAVLSMKEEIERMREQVQNLE